MRHVVFFVLLMLATIGHVVGWLVVAASEGYEAGRKAGSKFMDDYADEL